MTNLYERLDFLNKTLAELNNKLANFEIDESEHVEGYNDLLNEIHGEFMGYNASYILEQVDPIAYRTGMVDFVDSLNIEDDSDYQAIQENIEELESEIGELESEIEEYEE